MNKRINEPMKRNSQKKAILFNELVFVVKKITNHEMKVRFRKFLETQHQVTMNNRTFGLKCSDLYLSSYR